MGGYLITYPHREDTQLYFLKTENSAEKMEGDISGDTIVIKDG